MVSAKDIYLNADELENLPVLNRKNYLYEAELLKKQIEQHAKVLQVGSMDGMRIVLLLTLRPDLQLTGLDIEEDLTNAAIKNILKRGLTAKFVTGDITNPPKLPQYDYIICLNNTLGYIPDDKKAIEKMKKLGKHVIISVYGEKFTDDLAKEYFPKVLHLEMNKIDGNTFMLKDYSNVKRYTKREVESWGGEIIETPLGYFTSII